MRSLFNDVVFPVIGSDYIFLLWWMTSHENDHNCAVLTVMSKVNVVVFQASDLKYVLKSFKVSLVEF